MKFLKSFLIVLIPFFSCKSVKYKNLQDGVYADVVTNKGDILLMLYAKDVPMTVGNFVALAEGNHLKVTDSLKGKKYYNNTIFHRVIKDFMIQAGDHTGTGRGNAGYFFADEFPKDKNKKLLYKHDDKGVLSMANSGKNLNSNQFFITHKPTPWLDGKHTVFGHVIKGMSIVDSIRKGDQIYQINILRIGKEAKKFDAPKTFAQGVLVATKKEQERVQEMEVEKKKFLTKMRIDEAIKTSSGLKILVLKKGKGKKVKKDMQISVFYTLYTAYGTLLQSNIGKTSFKFSLDKITLIKGWEEGLLTMKEGEKARFFIPYYLGYGERAKGPIPAKSDLVFDIEVIKVSK